jgi:hypothetical protein
MNTKPKLKLSKEVKQLFRELVELAKSQKLSSTETDRPVITIEPINSK